MAIVKTVANDLSKSKNKNNKEKNITIPNLLYSDYFFLYNANFFLFAFKTD